ncbi:MAG: PD-(D/E)XK nuclease family protein [Phycisphaerales bacterium]|nr:MAG: PD-(D/E)XK nuclease family protein [Phycisphaerales bacterium]
MPTYSHSRIECFRHCSRKYFYRYIAKVELPEPPEQIATFLGSRVHDVLEHLYERVLKPRFVIEVKTSLRSEPDRDSALRQAFEYASRNGAPLVVVTDADAYEIYDRQASLDHASMLRAKFRLTAFHEADRAGLDILRP